MLGQGLSKAGQILGRHLNKDTARSVDFGDEKKRDGYKKWQIIRIGLFVRAPRAPYPTSKLQPFGAKEE